MLTASAVVQVSPTTNVGLPLGVPKGQGLGTSLGVSSTCPHAGRGGDSFAWLLLLFTTLPSRSWKKKKMEKIHIKHGASSPASLTNVSSLKRFIHSSHSRMRGNGTAHPRQSDARLVPKNAQQPVTCKLGWGWSLRDLYGGGRGCQSSLEELRGP